MCTHSRRYDSSLERNQHSSSIEGDNRCRFGQRRREDAIIDDECSLTCYMLAQSMIKQHIRKAAAYATLSPAQCDMCAYSLVRRRSSGSFRDGSNQCECATSCAVLILLLAQHRTAKDPVRCTKTNPISFGNWTWRFSGPF